MSYLLPDVLERFEPEGRIVPVVFDSPHSGCTYPRDFDHRIDRIHLRQTEDAFVDELFADAPGMGATLLRAPVWRRGSEDQNRSVEGWASADQAAFGNASDTSNPGSPPSLMLAL
jgi:N-formylglutamate amidohydrolase